MGARPLLLLLLLAASASSSACVDALPDKVALHPEAHDVEVINEPPNEETYAPAGEVSAEIIGRESNAALREAFNMLRNQAAAKGATFVAVDDVTSRAAWDFSGRTIVTIVGTAYRPK